MRLFGYYALHSFINQIRKLLKTWVLIFILICGLFGGLIGFGAATLSRLADEQTGITDSLPEDADAELFEEEGFPEDAPEAYVEEAEEAGLSEKNLRIIDAVIGVLLLLLFLFDVFSAEKNAGRLFLPADVNILFASPLKPQSVLMFRLMTQIGMMVFMAFYMLIQLPNLLNMGLTLPAAVACIFAFFIAIIIGTILQVLIYILSSEHAGFHQKLRFGLYALIALIGAGFALALSRTGGDKLEAFLAFFTAPAGKWIPFWGWLKAFLMGMMRGDTLGALFFLALTALGIVLLILLIWRMKADFYEDAMARSEETAALMEAAREGRGFAFRKSKKERSEKLTRDGMVRGFGASVFFHKTLYNRFRFAHLHLFTKTTETYLAAAVLLSLFLRFVLQSRDALPVMLVLGVFVFYRSLGNPLEEDTQKDLFRMVPESSVKKLFWSLLGGTLCCFLDLLPAALCAVLILGADVLPVLAFIPLILSVDFYATAVGAFLAISTPAHAGATVKQIIQITFIYFGLLPDIGLIAFGIVLDRIMLYGLIAILVNLALGLLFLALSAVFLEPESVPARAAVEEGVPPADPAQLKHEARHVFSRLALGSTVMLALTTALQFLCSFAFQRITHPWKLWLINFLPLYLVGVPVGLAVMRGVKPFPGTQKKLSVFNFVSALLIGFFLMFATNYLTITATGFLRDAFGVEQMNPVEALIAGQPLLPRILFVSLIGPFMEEYIFRKYLIDRMRIYGERLAVVTSAVMFGLFHGNFSQCFYACALGLVFGYVYLKTSKLRYTFLMHALVNFNSSVLGAYLTEQSGAEGMDALDGLGAADILSGLSPELAALAVYSILLMLFVLLGFILFLVRARRISFAPAARQLPKGSAFPVAYLNIGMALFLLLTLGMCVFMLMLGA